MLRCNTHIHTPYSFSAFESVELAVAAAKEEGIAALGINDFTTCDGFPAFASTCEHNRIYPLFNIELLVHCGEEPAQRSLANGSPEQGCMYLCGKALSHPLQLSLDSRNLLAGVWRKSQDYIWGLLDCLNGHLLQAKIACSLDYNDVRKKYAKKIVNERHCAKALYDALVNVHPESAPLEEALARLFAGTAVTLHSSDPGAIQNEIFSLLLAKGKKIAAEAEKEEYIRLQEARTLILDAGGIPCYPIGAVRGEDTADCHKEAALLADRLRALRIFAVEFFPLRSERDLLKAYVRTFAERGFCVSFGTNHDTPERRPLIPCLYGNEPLDEELERIAWQGACLLAAHQELRRHNKAGFVDSLGTPLVGPEDLDRFLAVGEEAIRKAAGPV